MVERVWGDVEEAVNRRGRIESRRRDLRILVVCVVNNIFLRS